MKRRNWISHLAVDVAAIAAFVALALAHAISGEAAGAAVLVIQGAYLLQFRNPPPGGPGAILLAFDHLAGRHVL